MLTPASSAPQGGPSSDGPTFCPLPPNNVVDPRTFEHRWAGLTRALFTLDGERVWTGEDGGRVRYGTAQFDALAGLWTIDWTFAQVPFAVRGILRGLHMLSDGLRGWAVSSDGWVIKTIDGGQSWTLAERIAGAFGLTPWENLYDVWFDENGIDGWIVGHHGIWYSDSGGICWQPANIFDDGGNPLTAQEVQGWVMELYAIDIRTGGDYYDCADPPAHSPFLGIVVGQPGWIFRSLDYGRNWTLVFNAFLDLCPSLDTADCLRGTGGSACGQPSVKPWFEFWDVQFSPDPTSSLALVVGGVGNNCGLVLASPDLGCTWGREYHECHPLFGDPLLNCAQAPEYNQALPPFRHKVFKTLYGVVLDPLNETGIASGYNGQHLRRDFLADGTPIWRDRSSFAKPEQWLMNASLDVTIFPLLPVALGRIGNQRLDWIGGMGGHIRNSHDGGDTWGHVAPGDGLRLRDVWFKPNDQPQSEDVGWRAAAHFNLEYSDNGGSTWSRIGAPSRVFPSTETLTSIAFAANGLNRVMVGTSMPGPNPSDPREGPRILRTDGFGLTSSWQIPVQVTYATPPGAAEYEAAALHRAAWAKDAGNQHFWAVGDKGLVLRSTDGGVTWSQLLLPLPQHLDLKLRGVAAAGPNTLVAVGCEGGDENCIGGQGVAYAWNGTGWNPIVVDAEIEVLTDVAIRGSQVFAVGTRVLPGGARRGAVLRYDPPTNAFLPFTPAVPMDLVPCAVANVALADHVLTQVEVTSNYDLWIGGVCGLLWQYAQASGSWIEHKSQTSADVRGMMFLSPSRGYVTADGGEGVNQVLVRYREPE